MDDFDFKELLGKGDFGKVYRVINKARRRRKGEDFVDSRPEPSPTYISI